MNKQLNDYYKLIGSRKIGKYKFETRVAVLEVLRLLNIKEFQRHVTEFDGEYKEYLDFKIPKNQGFVVTVIKDRYDSYLYIKSKKRKIELIKLIKYPETIYEYDDFVYLGIENPFYFLERYNNEK